MGNDHDVFLSTLPSRRHWGLYKLAGAVGLDVPGAITAVDDERHSASFVISTIDIDRSGDRMIPSGCKLDNYARNPQVFVDHREWHPLPIGSAEDPLTKQLSVVIEPDRVIATCYFDWESSTAREVFRLVQKGFLRAASIGFQPLQLRRMDEQGQNGTTRGHEIGLWDLVEFSVVAIPDNPRALVREIKSGDYVSVRKHFLPAPSGLTKGVRLKMTQKDMDGGDATDIPEEKDDGKEQAESTAQMPYGAKQSKAFYKSVMKACKKSEEGLGMHENRDVIDAHKALCEHCYKGLDDFKKAVEPQYENLDLSEEEVDSNTEGDEGGKEDRELGEGEGEKTPKAARPARTKSLKTKGLDELLHQLADALAAAFGGRFGNTPAAPAKQDETIDADPGHGADDDMPDDTNKSADDEDEDAEVKALLLEGRKALDSTKKQIRLARGK